MKVKSGFLVFTIVTLVIAVIGSTTCGYIGQADGPDLIIETASYRAAPAVIDEYGMPIMFPGKRLDFTICVKNIGNVAVMDSFYISNTRSNEDLERNYYSHTGMVNNEKQRIEPGETLEVTITDNIDDDAELVRFMVNPEGQKLPPIKSDGEELDASIKQVEESNYRNNAYELEIVP